MLLFNWKSNVPSSLGLTVPLKHVPPSCHHVHARLVSARSCLVQASPRHFWDSCLSAAGDQCGILDQPLAQPLSICSGCRDSVSPLSHRATLLGMKTTILADVEAEPTTCQAQPISESVHGPSVPIPLPPQRRWCPSTSPQCPCQGECWQSDHIPDSLSGPSGFCLPSSCPCFPCPSLLFLRHSGAPAPSTQLLKTRLAEGALLASFSSVPKGLPGEHFVVQFYLHCL